MLVGDVSVVSFCFRNVVYVSALSICIVLHNYSKLILIIHIYNYLYPGMSKSRLKGGPECKVMLMFCVGIVHTNLYNCIS